MNTTIGSADRRRSWLPAASFDTRAVASHERIDYWEEHCAEKVVGLRCSCLSENGLMARYEYFDLGPIKMIDINGGEHFIERSLKMLRQHEKDSAFLILILVGKVFVNRSGRCTVAEAGDVVLYDTNHPYVHGFPAHARQVIFEIPGDELRRRFSDWDMRELMLFGGSSNPCRVVPQSLKTMLHSVQDGSAALPVDRASLEKGIWAVMETAYSLANGNTRSTYHAQIIQRARKFIDQNLHDQELTPDLVAKSLNLSLRQLNRLFENEPLSLMELVMQRRLEGARADLLKHRGISISDLAYKWGFKNLAHFSRRFSERFGACPSHYARTSVGSDGLSATYPFDPSGIRN